MEDNVLPGVAVAVIETLQARAARACFVPEVQAALKRFRITDALLDQALSDLEADGLISVRSNYCADPHLDGVDLRIAALISRQDGPGDPRALAEAAIDALWQRWITDYLAMHRCS